MGFIHYMATDQSNGVYSAFSGSIFGIHPHIKQLKKQQQISNQYGITTYHDDGSVATIPRGQGVGLQGDMVLPDGAPYDPNVMYEFHGDGSYTVHPKPGGG